MLTLRDILHPSITGYLSKEFPGIPDDEIQRFIAAVRAAGREDGARFLGHHPLHSLAGIHNYHSVGLEFVRESTQTFIYLHAVLPYVGAGRTPRAWETTFLDMQNLAAHLPTNYKLLPAALLSQGFRPEFWMRDILGPYAWRDIIHWKQPRIGDLIFNEYD